MLYIVFYICFCFLFSSCATVVSPSGGEKDIFPPKILSSYPKNKSVNFNENQIIVNFDEYIQIKNRSEINFFPEINPRPTIKTKGRSIIINLSSGLKPNTTHIINFNKSIVDLNESNPLNDFEYVFSTGDFIDTCGLSGSIFNLKSNIKTTGAVVGLFKNALAINYDSLVRKTTADYFVYSDENGNGPESISITLNSDSDLSYRGVEIDYLKVLFESEDGCYKGDVSHDGAVDVIDVVNVVNFIFEISNPVYYEQCTSDLNNDDVIDVMDVVMVVNLIFGIDN